jgi:hypothetical protein
MAAIEFAVILVLSLVIGSMAAVVAHQRTSSRRT